MLLRLTDLLFLLLTPRLLWRYLRLWGLEYQRSPYGKPKDFQSVLALQESGQGADEMVYGETPFVTAWWLFTRAKVDAQSRVLDVGAGRGRAMLAARWLGAQAVGVELLKARAEPAAALLGPLGLEIIAEDAVESLKRKTPASHIYVVWTGFSKETRRRLAEAMSRYPKGTLLITSSYPPEHPQLELIAEHRAMYTWGLDRAYISAPKGSQ